MKSLYNALSIIIPVAAFIISVIQLLYNKEKKGLSKITKLGIAILIIAFIMGANTYLGNYISNKEKAISDSSNAHKEFVSKNRINNLQFSLDSLHRTLNNVDSILNAVYHLSLKKDNTGTITVVQNQFYQNTTPCRIIAEVSYTPNNQKQKLCNGEEIPIQYRPSNNHMTITIPYLKGKELSGGIVVDNLNDGEAKYDKNTGTIDFTANNGIYDKSKIELSVNVPIIPQSEPIRAVITVKNKANSKTLFDDFFAKPISEISTNSQSYIIGVDFTQNTTTKTITMTNGGSFNNGQVLVARR